MLLRCLPLAMLLAGVLLTSLVGAQEKLAFPQNPAQWVNGRPLTVESLEGKTAVLWFYEEQCPSCRAKWPGMLEVSRKYAGKPVVFIAVNSGNPRPAVEQYLKQCSIPWPTIVDPTREFEKAAGIDNPISLQNIHQMKIITPEGRITYGDWKDFEGSVAKAAAGAKWKIEPTDMPQTLMPAWQAIELGDYVSAAPLVKKGLADKKPEVKEAAEKLNDYAQAELAKAIEGTKQLSGAGDKWAAYQACRAVADRFKGYDLPEDFKSTGRELSQDDDVKKQIAAATELEKIKKTLGSTSAMVRKKAATALDKFIETNPGTDAAKEAEWIKEQLSGA